MQISESRMRVFSLKVSGSFPVKDFSRIRMESFCCPDKVPGKENKQIKRKNSCPCFNIPG
jgi:hypothetical protein